jgi:nucleoside-diphosphate-sugar epimerase
MRNSCLITGVDGFSGSNIFNFFKKIKKNSFYGISRKRKNKKLIKWDLNKNNSLILDKDEKIDWIVHTASIHKPVDFNQEPNLKKEKNKNMIKNLISFAKKNKIKNFIFFSTIDISYKNIFTKKKFYNLSKLHSEKMLINAHKKKYLDNLVILRIPAIIGKNSNENLINLIIKKLKRNQKIEINSNPNFNNLVHVDDLTKIVFKIINYKTRKRLINYINCLSKNPLSLEKIVKFLKLKLMSKSKILIKKKVEKKYFFIEANHNFYNFQFMSVKKVISMVL